MLTTTPNSTPPALDHATDATAVSRWRRALSLFGCLVLGAVLLVAAWAKTIDPASLERQVSAEGLDFLLPAAAVTMIALFLEWFLGLALLLGARHRLVLVPTTALVALFLFLTGRTYYRSARGLEVESGCGCFGNLVERTPAEAFWQDALLMVPALVFAWLAAGPAWPRRRLLAALLLGAAMTFFGWRAPYLPLDDLATRLSPGIDPLNLCAGAGGGSQVCMDAILPELEHGEHLIVLADLQDDAFAGAVPALNELALRPEAPTLWIVTSANDEEVFTFRFSHGPIFELREAPDALLRPLYRRLPRSFRVAGGRVVETWDGLPPQAEPPETMPPTP